MDSILVWNNYALVDSFNTGIYDTLFTSNFITNDSTIFAVFPVGTNCWLDNYVLINSEYALNLPSIGSATFDALSHYGELHEKAAVVSFGGDSLSSKAIDLSGLRTSDALFLSFKLQAGGIGDIPESKDIFIVQFKDSSETWNTIWSSDNESEADWTNTEFKHIYVSLDNSKYFFKGFQFRFINYASLSSVAPSWQYNADQWHLDYVILDKNRSDGDNYIKDVCFTSPPKTLINGYQNIPWKHYTSNTSLTQSSSLASISNGNLTSANVNFTTQISETTNQTTNLLSNDLGGTSALLLSNQTKDFTQNYSGFVFASSEPNTADFTIKYKLKSDLSDLIPGNDSAEYHQVFDSYYAYDDGSAESGYGINAYLGKFAYYFPLLVSSDTLTAFDIYFNNTLTNVNNNIPLNLMVWKNNNGLPGDILHSTQIVNPKQSDSLNRFISYKLDAELLVSDGFFIGWEQQNDDLVNIGLDRNTISTDKMFFKTGTDWKASTIAGSVMLRPRFGTLSFLSTKPLENPKLFVFPNPTNGLIYVTNLSNGSMVMVSDIWGKNTLQQTVFSEKAELNLTDFPSGIYIISAVNKEGISIGNQKIIKL